jgi:hypothetical protein
MLESNRALLNVNANFIKCVICGLYQLGTVSLWCFAFRGLALGYFL